MILFSFSVLFFIDWAVYGICPTKPFFAKEVKENGVCHIQVDDHFSVYFEPCKYLDDTQCHLYLDGHKTTIYAYCSTFETKYSLVQFLLSYYYYGTHIVVESEHYKPCK